MSIYRNRSGVPWCVVLAGALCSIMAGPAVAQTNTAEGTPTPPEKIDRRVLIAADINTVWDAWTTGEVLDDWFPYPLASADFSEGGKVLFGDAQDPTIRWEILSVDKPRLLQFRLRILEGAPAVTSEPSTRVTVRLSAWGPSTGLHFVQDEMGLSPATALSSGPIWDNMLSRLKTRVETGRELPLSFIEAEQMERERKGEPAEPPVANPMAYPQQITLYVNEIKDSRPWYERILGLPRMGFDSHSITFQGARPILRVQEVAADTPPVGGLMITYHVERIDDYYDRVKAGGAKIVLPLTDGQRAREFRFDTPSGHRFQIIGPGKPAATGPARSPTTQPSGK